MKKLFVLCMVFTGAVAADKTPLLQDPSAQGASGRYQSVANKEAAKKEEPKAPAKRPTYVARRPASAPKSKN